MTDSHANRRVRWCNYPRSRVPAPGEVGAGFKATCLCGKRVSVTVRGLFWRHKTKEPA